VSDRPLSGIESFRTTTSEGSLVRLKDAIPHWDKKEALYSADPLKTAFTLVDVLHSYQLRFNIGFSTQEETDIINFLIGL
jgi:hypothetical protein